MNFRITSLISAIVLAAVVLAPLPGNGTSLPQSTTEASFFSSPASRPLILAASNACKQACGAKRRSCHEFCQGTKGGQSCNLDCIKKAKICVAKC